jgi:hypothetical protein
MKIQERINLTELLEENQMRSTEESNITKQKKMAEITTYLPIITLNLNGLKPQIKIDRPAN